MYTLLAEKKMSTSLAGEIKHPKLKSMSRRSHWWGYVAAATSADLACVNEATTDPSWILSLHPKVNLYLKEMNFHSHYHIIDSFFP